jgi:hypothetical protein
VAEIEALEQVVRLRLRSGEIVPTVLPPEAIEADVEFFQRQVMLDACALDLLVRIEGMPKCAYSDLIISVARG